MLIPSLNASSRIMYHEAISRGITCTTFGDKETILMQKGSMSWYVRGSRTSLQSSVGKTIADKKQLTKKILLHFHIPTARGVFLSSLEAADELRALHFPVVLKPTEERHGKGVRVGVHSYQEAVELIANECAFPLLVEEQLAGIEYRIICINYKFIAAAYRKPAFIVGDGRQTITELIDEKNKHPWRGSGHSNNLSIIEVDGQVEQLLTTQQLTLTSIPKKGAEVLLRKTANLSTGGEAWDVTETVCSENRELFEKIARVCDLNVIGIDVMCQSLSTPIASQSGAGVIEVNASPGLRMHHFPMQGQAKNIAGLILDMVESSFA